MNLILSLLVALSAAFTPLPPSARGYEEEFFHIVNIVREARNIQPLSHDSRLDAMANRIAHDWLRDEDGCKGLPTRDTMGDIDHRFAEVGYLVTGAGFSAQCGWLKPLAAVQELIEHSGSLVIETRAEHLAVAYVWSVTHNQGVVVIIFAAEDLRPAWCPECTRTLTSTLLVEDPVVPEPVDPGSPPVWPPLRPTWTVYMPLLGVLHG